jgi:hypothetical protein
MIYKSAVLIPAFIFKPKQKAMRKIITLILLIFFISNSGNSQTTTLVKSFNDQYNWTDIASCAKPTPDGGIIIAGVIKDTLGSQRNYLFLMKLDSSYQIIWTKEYNSGEIWDAVYKIDLTSDKGFMLIGAYTSGLANAVGFCTIKVDSVGNYQWTKVYSGYTAFNYCKTSDKGYIMCGSASGVSNTVLGLTCIDSLGNLKWSKKYSGTPGAGEVAMAVKETLDHGFIVAGYTFSFNVYTDALVLFKTDSLGNQLWTKFFDSQKVDYGTDLILTSDSGYIVAGVSTPVQQCPHPLLFKADKYGNIVWGKLYGRLDGNHPDCGSAAERVIKTNDNGYAFIYFNGFNIPYLVKTDSVGNFQWAKSFPDTLWDQSVYQNYSLWKGTQGEYMFCVSSSTNHADIMLVRTTNDQDSCSTFYSTFWQNNYTPSVIDDITFAVNNAYGSSIVNYNTEPVSFSNMTICDNNDIVTDITKNITNQALLNIFPNPFSSETTFQTNEYLKDATLTFFNSYNQKVKQVNNISGYSTMIKRENLPCGLYFYTLVQQNKLIGKGKAVIIE